MNFEYCEGIVHVVKEGDTLYQLSRAYEVPLALIMRANPYVDVYNLQVGSELCIPVMPPIDGPGPVIPDCPNCPGRPNRPNGSIQPDVIIRPIVPVQPDVTVRPIVPVQPDVTVRPSVPVQPDMSSRPGSSVQPDMPRPSRPNGSIQPDNSGYPGQMVRPGRPITMPRPVPGNSDSIMSYVVKDNDTLEEILKNFNVDLEDLLNFNNSNGIWLKPGATLRIPEHIEED